jgi:TonB family protein
MSWPGSSPRLDRVSAIWPTDAEKLMDCGVETVHDLIGHVQLQEGLSALSERSRIPVEQLRSYFHVAQKESSKERARQRGTLWLLAIAVVAVLVAIITRPKPKTPAEEKYAALHARYVQNDPSLAGELDEVVDLYERTRKGVAVAADSARLDTLVGGAAVIDGTMSPHLANLVSLQAAVKDRAAMRAANEDDFVEYNRLFERTRELDALLLGTRSHRDYAIENSRRATNERALVYSWLRPTLDPEAEARLADSISANAASVSTFTSSRISELEGNLESDRDALTSAVSDSVRAMTARRLDSVEQTLSDHTELLDSLIRLSQSRPAVDTSDGGPTGAPIQPAVDESDPAFADEERAREEIGDAWPAALKSTEVGGTVCITATIGVDGKARNVGVLSSSGQPRLDSAAVSAVRRIMWRPGTRNGRPIALPITRPITFELRGRPATGAITSCGAGDPMG